MIGLRNALITPKIRATAIRVSTFEVVDPAVSWMPGSTAVATASAAAETARRSRKRMGQSWHPRHRSRHRRVPAPQRGGGPAATAPGLPPPAMDEEPPQGLRVLLDAAVERLDFFLPREPEHPLLAQSPAL